MVLLKNMVTESVGNKGLERCRLGVSGDLESNN